MSDETTDDGAGQKPAHRPVTPPFDWGVGPVVNAAEPAPRQPEPYFTSDSDGDAPDTVQSPIDALFGETQFKDYEAEPLLGPLPAPVTTVLPTASGSSVPPTGPDRGTLSKNQRILFWVAGCVLAALVLAVLFVIGMKFAPHPESTPAAAISTSPSATPSPTPTMAPIGPAAVGVHKWSDLRGGECLDPFTTPYAEKFTVVDCAVAHPAQMVFRGTFPAATPASPSATPSPSASPSAGAADGGYPGLEALQAQINLLCTAPGVIDLTTAGGYSDIQFQAAYAANAAEWKSGQHDYFCFVNRSGGGPITGSVAGTPAG